jgi:hypothetical protein
MAAGQAHKEAEMGILMHDLQAGVRVGHTLGTHAISDAELPSLGVMLEAAVPVMFVVDMTGRFW